MHIQTLMWTKKRTLVWLKTGLSSIEVNPDAVWLHMRMLSKQGGQYKSKKQTVARSIQGEYNQTNQITATLLMPRLLLQRIHMAHLPKTNSMFAYTSRNRKWPSVKWFLVHRHHRRGGERVAQTGQFVIQRGVWKQATAKNAKMVKFWSTVKLSLQDYMCPSKY